MDVLSIAVESLSLSGSLVASTWQQVHVAASTKERWKVGKGDFGEIFDGYIPNLMMLWSIRNSSHWYGGRYVEKVKYVYCTREKNMK